MVASRRSPKPGALRGLAHRPDATESPFTVDGRHLHFEMDVTTTPATGSMACARPVVCALQPALQADAGVRSGNFGPASAPSRRAPGRIDGAGVGDDIAGQMDFFGQRRRPDRVQAIADLKLPTAADGIGNDKVERADIPVAYGSAAAGGARQRRRSSLRTGSAGARSG